MSRAMRPCTNQPLRQAIDCIRVSSPGPRPAITLGLALSELAGIIVIAFVPETILFKRKTP